MKRGSFHAPRPRATRVGHGATGADEGGQSLVEFALVFPMFLILLMGLIEFSFALNALLNLNYATRNGALIAAEAGNAPGADCVILQNIDQSISDPANEKFVLEVRVSWTDANGSPLDINGNLWTGGGTQASNVYTRTTSPQVCPDGNQFPSINYIQTAANYPPSQRCNDVLGSLALCAPGHPTLDDVGVQITYNQGWRTPMHTLVGLMGNGRTIVQSNEMRMEPVL